jgi:hypothetical protein
MDDPNQERFQRIERKLSLLLTIAIAQSVVILLLVVGMFVSRFLASTMPMIIFLVVTIGFLVLFRKQLPGWFGSVSRFVFSKLLSAQKPNSMKDID